MEMELNTQELKHC